MDTRKVYTPTTSKRELRDTQCSYCYKWTHRLTDGTVQVFCDWLCEKWYKANGGPKQY